MFKAIREAGRTPEQRNTFYEPIKVLADGAPSAIEAESRLAGNKSKVLEGNLATRESLAMTSLEQVHCFVSEVWQETKDSSKKFPELFRNGEPKYPIPFFGNLLKAEIFTVGLNPSAGEFKNRGWQDGLSDEALANRLLDYFSSPHDWFRVWSEALGLLNGSHSYANGRVAHLDISPRATQSFGSFSPEQSKDFNKMLRQDIGWLFQIISQSTNLKLILMAGTASKKCYLDKLAGECAGQYFYKFTGKKSAKGVQCRFWQIEGNGKSIPVFFSGSSPSDRRIPKPLVENVRANADSLNLFLRPPSPQGEGTAVVHLLIARRRSCNLRRTTFLKSGERFSFSWGRRLG